MAPSVHSHFALVLPGAVARGAFEAGIISALVDHDLRIDRIVATSSGALNGIAYAAGIRAGREKEMSEALSAAWIENGAWNRSMSFNLWNFIRGQGFSNQDGLLEMMRSLVKPCEESAKREVELHIIVSPLDGVISKIGDRPATTYEKQLKFAGEDFDTHEGLERMFKAVSAACAFPGLFNPVDLGPLGPCVDGGAVNNAPIGCALQENDVGRVMIAIPFPAVMEQAVSLKGFGFVNHLVEILINERLFRDLNLAQETNDQVDHLQALVNRGVMTPAQRDEVVQTLNLRKIEITQIRPAKRLKQSAFSGFFHREDRVALIDEGRRAANEILKSMPPVQSSKPTSQSESSTF